jgi:hypothetical protein
LEALTCSVICFAVMVWTTAGILSGMAFANGFSGGHWREPCFDLWEEISGHHYYTRLVQYAALADGSAWMEAAGDVTRAQAYRAAAHEIRQRLDAHFDPDEGVYVCRFANAADRPSAAPARRLDMAVPLGVIHAARAEGPHSVSIRRRLPRWRGSRSFLRKSIPSTRSVRQIALLRWDAMPAIHITAAEPIIF